jgi:hypothetical protein
MQLIVTAHSSSVGAVAHAPGAEIVHGWVENHKFFAPGTRCSFKLQFLVDEPTLTVSGSRQAKISL